MDNEEKQGRKCIITRDIAGKLNLDETYVFMCLLFKSDYRTGESHVLRKTLCKVTGIKDEDTITKYTSKFQELKYLDKSSVKGYNEEANRISTSITYMIDIPVTNWVRFDSKLLAEDIPNKLKAFLVLLKCLCLNNTNVTYYSKSKIAQLLNMDRGTVSKYIKMAIEHDKLVEGDKFFMITDENIMVDLPEQVIEETNKVYGIIRDYCIKQNVIPPPYDAKLASHLLQMRFNTPEDVLKRDMENNKYRSVEDYKYYSLVYNLPIHCKNLPKQINSLQYFIKAFLGKKKQVDKCYTTKTITL